MTGPATIYADYQATTPLDPRVREAMAPFWGEAFGNPHSTDHIVGWRAGQAVEHAAASVAGLVGADPDEVVFTSGATEANNLALLGLARRASPERRRILVSAVEHKCVLAATRSLQAGAGFTVETIPVDRDGTVNLSSLADLVGDDVLVASVMAVNNEIGSVNDMAAVAEVLAPHGIPLQCDAAQAPCAVDLRHLARHADLISLSAHKMYGPQGIGALVVRRDLQERIEPLFHGGGQQNGLRSGTLPLALCVGFGEAAALFAGADGSAERERVARLRDRFVGLLDGHGITCRLNGPPAGSRHPGNANLGFVGLDAQSLLAALQPRVAASTGAACASGIPEPSHVLRAVGLSPEACEGSVRFSFGRFTSGAEVEGAAGLVTKAAMQLAREGTDRPR